MLVGGLLELGLRKVGDPRHAGVDAGGFQAGIDDGDVGSGAAHHRGPHEEAVLEARNAALGPVVLRVIGIHEDVGADLQLVVYLARRFEQIGAGARAGDLAARQAGLCRQRQGCFHRIDRRGDRGAALPDTPKMLGRPLVGLQSGVTQVFAGGNGLGNLQRRLAGINTAAVGADIDLDQHVDGDAELAGRRVDVLHVAGIVGADGDLGLLRQRGEAPEFGHADHFVGNQHIGHAALDHGLGFADLLAADADRAESDLAQRDLRAFVALGMRPQHDPAAGDRFPELLQIVLEGVEVEDQRRCIDLSQGHARLRGKNARHYAVLGPVPAS